MKRFLTTLCLLALVGTAVKAQSCDARYPMGEWQTRTDDKDPKYFVSLSVYRDKGVCGSLSIGDYKTEEGLFDGDLTYAGKEMKDNMPTGTYYFNVKTESGKPCTISVNGSRKPVITATGELKDHPAFKEDIIHCPGLLMGTGGYTHAQYMESEKALLDDLRHAVKDSRVPTEGFGNLQQFINAHAKLDFTKPKYLKPKGAGAINIRKEASATAAKIGELKPGQTLLVIDEFDGWCQVQLDEQTKGWVSLSVVSLTNTPSAAATASAATAATAAPVETTCPLVGSWYGWLGNGDGSGWGETTVFLMADKKAGVNPKMAQRQSNGAIDMGDEAFVREWNYNLVFVRTIADNTYEFTVQRMVGKQLKSGKLQIKRNGDSITMTGLDAWAKQQPFHGKTIGQPNPTYQ